MGENVVVHYILWGTLGVLFLVLVGLLYMAFNSFKVK